MPNATVEAWLQDLEVRGRTAGTIRSYQSALRAFTKHTADVEAKELSATELKSYLAWLRGRGVSAATIKGHYAAIASYLDYLVHEGFLDVNPVPGFRTRYLDRLQTTAKPEHRRLLTIEEARTLVRGTMDLRTRAILAVLFKTGVRREELSSIDVTDIDWQRGSISLKPHAKRTNTLVYFDDETNRLLKRWIVLQQARTKEAVGPLFGNQRGQRLGANGIYNLVTAAAERWGLHNPSGPVRERFTPHCARHWFTTHLRRAGLPDNYIAELRGDSDARTMDTYTHIDHDELRLAYLTAIPQLNL